MLRFIKSRPGEFLVVGRGGTLRNLGVGVSTWQWPGASSVRVPTGKEEAPFCMTQETADGIPLRFKGSAVYRVVDPVAAALAFDFEAGMGSERLRGLVSSVCLGELRDVVSHMSMKDCIEQRKTTLTSAVWKALSDVLEGAEAGQSTSWGIALDVVLVSQVFVVDEDLRGQLEAKERADILTRSRQAEIRRDEEIRRSELESLRRLTVEDLERSRESSSIAREKLKLTQAVDLETQASKARVREEALEQDVALRLRQAEGEARGREEAVERDEALARRSQEAEADRRREHLEQERAMAELALEVEQRKLELKKMEVEKDMLRERAEGALEHELLPQRQVPKIAEALAGLYDGAKLSIYGGEDLLATRVLPLFERLLGHLGEKGEQDVS